MKDLVPWPGIEPKPLHWKCRVLATGPPERSPNVFNFDGESESCSVMSNSLQVHGLYSPWNSPGQNTGVGSHSLLQGIFATQESNRVQSICLLLLVAAVVMVLLESYLRNHCLIQSDEGLHPCFLIVLGLTFRSLIHFIAFCLWGKGPPTSFFCMWISSCPALFVKKITFSIEWSWPPGKNSVDHK